jgi:hypothetical protein
MEIQGCAYKGLEFFEADEYLFCSSCGSLQERTGLVVFGGHIHSDSFTGDVLVWTEPIRCLYCDHVIRDMIIPCSDYILDLRSHVIPRAY